jgi:hypothetical protein
MAQATWPTREVPILEAIAEIEARPGPVLLGNCRLRRADD